MSLVARLIFNFCFFGYRGVSAGPPETAHVTLLLYLYAYYCNTKNWEFSQLLHAALVTFSDGKIEILSSCFIWENDK